MPVETKLYSKDLQFVLSNYNKAKGSTGMTQLFTNIKKWKDQYLAKTRGQVSNFYAAHPDLQTTADIFAPETFKAIETIKSKLMSYMYQEDAFEIEEHADCPPEKRDAYLQYLKNQRRSSKHKIEMEKLVLNLLKYGTGIVKKYWKIETVIKRVPSPIYEVNEKDGKVMIDKDTGEPIITGMTVKDVAFKKGYPYLKAMDLTKMFIIGETSNFYEVDGIIEEIDNVDWDDLWKLRKRKQRMPSGKLQEVGIYFNLEHAVQIQLVPGETEKDKIDSAEYVDLVRNPVQNDKTEQRTETVKHNLLEAWAWRDLKGTGKKERCVITVLDKKLVIRRSKNPFDHNRFPYLLAPCITREDSIYGLGMCQLVEGLQWELNAKRNQLIDSVTFLLNNMWLRVDQGIADHQLRSKPGGIIDSIRPDGVKPLEKDIMDLNAGLAAVQAIKEDIKEVSGATPPLQGQKVRGRGTLGEVRSMKDEASYRIVDIMNNIEEHILYPDMYMTHALNQQFIEKEVTIPMTRKIMIDNEIREMKNVPIVLHQQDIRWDFKFIIHVATQTENRLVKNQALMNYLMVLSKTGLPPQLIGVATYRLMKQIWINLQLGEADIVFPKNLEAELYAMLGQPPAGPGIAQPTPGNPEAAEKKLDGKLTGMGNSQGGS